MERLRKEYMTSAQEHTDMKITVIRSGRKTIALEVKPDLTVTELNELAEKAAAGDRLCCCT